MNYINKYFTLLLNWTHDSSSFTERIMRNVLGSLFIRTSAVLLAFLSSVILARVLGVNDYGLFVYAISWLNILLVIATLGFDKLLVRQIAIYKSRMEWGKFRGIQKFALPRTIILSICLSLLLCGIVYFTSKNQPLAFVFYFVAILVPILAVIRLQQATLQGLDLIGQGQIPELIIQPVILLLLVFLLHYGIGLSLRAPQAMLINAIAGTVALFMGSMLIKHSFPLEARGADSAISSHEWIPSLFPLMLVSGIYILNDQLATIMLGFLSHASQVAIYAAAERWAKLDVFMLFALNPALGPIFASLHANNDKERLQKVVTLSAQVVTVFALIPLLVYIFAPNPILSIFGDDFFAGRTPLIILGIGQFINAMTGSVGVLLSMVGYERTVVLGAGLGIFVNLLLGLWLIPSSGATGAAIGASISVFVTNIILTIFIYRKLKIYPTALGPLFV